MIGGLWLANLEFIILQAFIIIVALHLILYITMGINLVHDGPNGRRTPRGLMPSELGLDCDPSEKHLAGGPLFHLRVRRPSEFWRQGTPNFPSA